jgi:oxygen-dependent protoporphyrinogen oxidase
VVSRRVDVAVVGGGIAGLTAARALHERGKGVVVLEAGPRWGGVIRTEREHGFLLEGGPDTMLAAKPDGVELCRALGLADRIVPTNPRESAVFVLRRGRLHRMPEGMVLGVPTRIGPLLRSGLFGWRAKLRMAAEPWLPAPPAGPDPSIAAFLGACLGEEAVRIVGEPLLAGIHAGDARRLSMRATFPRLFEIGSRGQSLVRGMRAARRAQAGGVAAGFVSLEDGLGEMVDALVACLPVSALMSGTPALRVRREGGGFVIESAAGTFEARALVMALPPPRAASLLEDLAPVAARMLAAIPFASTATVLVGYRRADVAHPLDGYGLLVPRGEGLRTTAVTFSSTKLPGRAPEGHVLLRAFLGGVHDPGVVDLDDGALAATFEREMAKVLGIRGDPVITRVYRWPEGTPQMEVGHLDRVAEIDRHLAAVPGLFLTGAGLRATGIPDVIADATAAAYAAALRDRH